MAYTFWDIPKNIRFSFTFIQKVFSTALQTLIQYTEYKPGLHLFIINVSFSLWT